MDLLGIVGVASGSVAIPLSTATSIATISRGVRAQQVASDAVGDPRLAKFSLHASCQDVRERDVKIIVLRNGRVPRLLIIRPIDLGFPKRSSTWTRTRHIRHSRTATHFLASTSIIREETSRWAWLVPSQKICRNLIGFTPTSIHLS